MTTPIKKLLMGLAMSGFLCSVAIATSVREYQQMTDAQKDAFLDKDLLTILSRIKAYDPQLAARTRYYMVDETNSFGGGLGLGAVLDVVSVCEQKHPDSMDKVQIETITKIIIRNYWKREGYVVPASVLGLKEKVSPPTSAGNVTNSIAP